MLFEPNYHMLEDVVRNRKPKRLPMYEHTINPVIMERILGLKFAEMRQGDEDDLQEFFKYYCGFYRKMTYDTVSFEVAITDELPGHGAIMGGMPGPIQTRKDFEQYPWDQLPRLFWQKAESQFVVLDKMMPKGMKAIGGIGNGVFEISEDLVGLEHLAYMQADDSDLYARVYQKIGDLMYGLWDSFLKRFGNGFAVCRIGDDLGFKSGLLTSPSSIRSHIIPQYKRIIELIHSYDKPFLWHSCGCIFDIMDEMIDIGINAKHSNEDQIAFFDRWIELYSGRIGLLGGFDLNILCQEKPEDIRRIILADGRRFRQNAGGYALGSGNSIPDYVPVESYMAMVEAVGLIREMEMSDTAA
jgi:uroporphyrinogen decarboxylase